MRLTDAELAQLGAWGFTAAPDPTPAPSKNRTLLCGAPGGGRVLVKLATGYGQRGVHREGRILAALAAVALPPLRLPRVVAFSPELGMLALEWLDAAPTAFEHHRVTRRYDPELAERLGRALGALHARTAADPARFDPRDAQADRFDLLEALLRPRPDFYARQPRATLEVISRLQQDGAALRGLALLSDADRRCLIHGDCKQSNVLLAGGDPVLIDWELSSWGDGARDVGSLAADYAAGWMAPEHEAEVVTQPDLQRFLSALVGAYAPAQPDVAERVLRWCGLGLVVMAYGEAHLRRALEPRGQRLLELGQALLADPAAGMEELLLP